MDTLKGSYFIRNSSLYVKKEVHRAIFTNSEWMEKDVRNGGYARGSERN